MLVVTGGARLRRAGIPGVFAARRSRRDLHDLKDESEVFEDIGDWPYDVLVLYNMSQKISEKRKKNFLALLDRGVGLVVLHHAIAAFNDWPEYWKIIGARYFLKDTGVDGKTIPASTYRHDVDIPCKIEDPAHPVTAGLKDFVVRDETYKGFLVSRTTTCWYATPSTPTRSSQDAAIPELQGVLHPARARLAELRRRQLPHPGPAGDPVGEEVLTVRQAAADEARAVRDRFTPGA